MNPINDAAPLAGGARPNDSTSYPNHNNASNHRSVPARQDAPETSHQAARRMEGIAGALCQRVLGYIRERGAVGATDAETQEALGMLTQTETPRRRALAQSGAVVDSGQRRLTPSRRKAIVWVTPEHAPNPRGSAW